MLEMWLRMRSKNFPVQRHRRDSATSLDMASRHRLTTTHMDTPPEIPRYLDTAAELSYLPPDWHWDGRGDLQPIE